MRLFIAIKPDSNVFNAIKAFQTELRSACPYKEIRWVDPNQFHLTLQFLGEINPSYLPKLNANLNAVAENSKTFDLHYESIGLFGSAVKPRVLWLGSKKSSELKELFNQVLTSTAFLQIENPGRLTPHITLARFSNNIIKEDALKISNYINSLGKPDFGITKTEAIELIESKLTPNGPIYKTLNKFNLR